MIWFWIAAALISAGAAMLIIARAAGAAKRGGGGNPALAVYQRQMSEIDDLAERGLLAEGERRGARAETGRRLLAAADRDETAATPIRPVTIVLAACIAPLLGLVIYLAIGAQGMTDQPFVRRVAQWETADPQNLDAPRMAAILRGRAAKAPTDPEPLRYLALAELQSGQPLEAVQALRRATAVAPGNSNLWALMGDVLTLQADGDITPEARTAFRKALALDPKSVDARRFLAQAKIQSGDVAGGLAEWKALLADLPADDELRGPLSQAIEVVARTGKLPLPAQPQNQNAPDIQAMVDGLAARLAANGDDPQGWVRLVRAYTVLGEIPKRDAALAEARKRYAGKPEVLKALDSALVKPPS